MTHADSLNLAPNVNVPLRHLTKHALITGASGTGKSTTAGALVERLADAGVSVLVLDAKGDLESLSASRGRVVDPYGYRGTRRRLHVGEMGADLVSRALELSEAQTGALHIAIAAVEDSGFTVESLADLRTALNMAVEHRDELAGRYGLVTPSSVAAVQRALLPLERDAGEAFGAPGFDPFEFTEPGEITVFNGSRLAETPAAYGALAGHVLNALYTDSPECGDVSRPKLAVMIDEAHLIFSGATPAVVRRIEQAARLIRSRGVMLIFATQSPADLPDAVAAQLLTRIQHGLRGTTPRQMRGIRAAAESMPGGSVAEILTLGVGEALFSVPDDSGAPREAVRARATPGKVALAPLPVENRVQPGPSFSPASVQREAPTPVYFSDPVPVELEPIEDERPRGAGWRAWLILAAVAFVLLWPW